jgi:hypothetical protein
MKNILTILLIFLFLFGCKLFNRNQSGGGDSSVAADTVQFVNSRERLTGKLAENYVDFAFNYPKSWVIDPATQKPGSSNFIKVEKAEDDYTMENFAVGYFSGGSEAIPILLNQLSSQFSKGFPNFEKVSEGNTRVGSYDGYELRFNALVKGTPKGDIPMWGRVVFLPNPEGKKQGLILIMIATPLAADVKSVHDVGVKGELPVILNSFKLK